LNVIAAGKKKKENKNKLSLLPLFQEKTSLSPLPLFAGVLTIDRTLKCQTSFIFTT
jgi:hypothetical protein